MTPRLRWTLGATIDDARRDSVLLRLGVAFVWLATGAGVLHPHYREVGERYLDALGLPHALMWATCAFEVALGLWVALRPATALLAWAQIGLVASFTAILAVSEPLLLASPYGVLTKNVPIVGSVLVAWWLERDGWTPRALGALRGSVAAIWVTEGLFPKILFQQGEELAIAERTGLAFGHPSALLVAIGLAQIAGGVAALLLSGRLLRWLLAAQIAALVALALVVGALRPDLWSHPFGPLTKNAPIILGTWVVLRRCSSSP